MTAIDEREHQWKDRLGEPLTDERDMPGGGSYKAFMNGILWDVPGAGVYTFAEASVANLFIPPLAPPGEPPTAPATATVYGIDVASYQPADLTALIGSLQPRPEHVVVRLYQDIESPPQAHSLAQIESARACGCTVGSYVWIYRDVDGGASVDSALDLADRAGLAVPVLWLDLETYVDGSCPTVANVQRAVDASWARGVTPGIYTGRWFWQDHMAGTTQFADLPLWYAHYGIPPTMTLPAHFGGWTEAAGHQYTSDPVDCNLFRAAVTVA